MLTLKFDTKLFTSWLYLDYNKVNFYFSVKDYIENVTGFVGLIDKLSKNVIPESCNQDALYPAHLTPIQIHDGIKNQKLHQGTFHASRDNFLEGTASVNGFEKPVSDFILLRLN